MSQTCEFGPSAVGNLIAATPSSNLPELGSLPRQATAALAGVAPFNRDSGVTTTRQKHPDSSRARPDAPPVKGFRSNIFLSGLVL
jgi:hypothetical protein